MLRTLLFDLGNVLLYFSHDQMFRQVGDLCGWSGERVRGLFLEHDLITEFECGRLSRTEFHRRLESLTGREMDSRRLMRALSNIFQPNESLLIRLDQFQSAGLRLVLLSNTNAAHISFIKKQFDVLSKFDDMILSYEVGAMKPDPVIYAAALKAIQCDPNECLYTDDIAENVERARGFGLQAEVFIDTKTYLAHLEQRHVRIGGSHSRG